ncbi:MAG: hypothetical protein ACTHK4_17685 [Mycobacteriales bacterium]
MEHVVFYQSSQGTPAFRRVASIDDAISFAEHLRNVEGITDFSVYSLAPVTLSLRAYYHVEVSGSETAAASAAAPLAPAPSTPPPPPGAPVAAESPTPALSFHALEEASAPVASPAAVPFAAAPLPPATDTAPETFVRDEPAELPPADHGADEPAAVDPNVVDPTVEEVVPVPTGRRSMGFFARS